MAQSAETGRVSPLSSRSFLPAWWRDAPPTARRALAAAQLGWMLDAMDFALYLMAIPALQHEFGFDKATAGLLATVALLSSAFGGVFFGALADRIGRTRALSATVLVYSFASLGTAMSGSVVQLLAWRTLLGLGLGGEWSAGAVLVAESWPAEHRGKAIGFMQAGWAIGYLVAALLAALILPTLGWRALFVVGVAPALLAVWIRRRVAEPAAWSARRPSASSALAALRTPAVLRRLGAASLLSAAVMFGYWGLFTWVPSFLANPVDQGGAGLGLVRSAVWIVPMQLGAFAGYASFGFFADRFGRRPSAAVFLVAAAALVPLYGGLARTPWALLALGPLLGFFGHGFFSVFGALLAELFPTAVRGAAQGLAYNAGRALSAAAPTVIGALATRHGLGTALGATSAFFLAGALLLGLVPETRGRELPD